MRVGALYTRIYVIYVPSNILLLCVNRRMYKLYMHFYNVAVLYVCRRSSQLMTPQWLGGHTIQRDAVIGCNFFAHASSSA